MGIVDGFDKLARELSSVFDHYYEQNSTFAAVKAEMMKINRENGDISMEEVWLVLLNPATMRILAPVLPILHEESARAIFLEVLEKTLERITPTPDDGVDLEHEPPADTDPE